MLYKTAIRPNRDKTFKIILNYLKCLHSGYRLVQYTTILFKVELRLNSIIRIIKHMLYIHINIKLSKEDRFYMTQEQGN